MVFKTFGYSFQTEALRGTIYKTKYYYETVNITIFLINFRLQTIC